MTRKHFETIAKIIIGSSVYDPFYNCNTLNQEELVTELADYFQSENPRFDRVRFLHACGLGEEQ